MNSNLNSPQADAALKLFPMLIPGWKESVLPAGKYHAGIPSRIYSPSTPLYMVIDPALTFSTTLAVGDSVHVYVNDQPTDAITQIREGEENQRIEIDLKWGWMKEGLNTMFYRMTRPSGNYADSEPVLNLLFHYPVSDITVSHPPSLGPTQPATLTLTRTYPRDYDRVTLTIGTWSKNIANVPADKSFTYTLTDADLRQIGGGTHPVSARLVDQLDNISLSPIGSVTLWQDHYTSLADTYNGWVAYTAARSGSIREFPMNNQPVTAFFNFTADAGPPTGFAGVVLYRDFTFVPGQYRFTFEGTHVADSPNPSLVNPILCAEDPERNGDRREVPKNGIWYLFLKTFTITTQQTARLYISNYQDGSNGNDFGLRNIKVEQLNSSGGIMSAFAAEPELPLYTGEKLPIEYPPVQSPDKKE
ncbi:hypothetical protein ACIOUG_14590 [Pseudomonas sp. NPDC087803]|uniref:hypothetical protein n=1 Tax=Pseudomonas sp. NPDC087803 TaxID=3364448 RepID=UPI00380A7FE6